MSADIPLSDCDQALLRAVALHQPRSLAQLAGLAAVSYRHTLRRVAWLTTRRLVTSERQLAQQGRPVQLRLSENVSNP